MSRTFRIIQLVLLVLLCATLWWANAVSAQSPADKFPVRFKLLSAVAVPDGVKLTWEPPAGQGEYRVTRWPSTPAVPPYAIFTVRSGSNTWVDRGYKEAATYSMEWYPDQRTGNGASNSVKFVPGVAAARPVGLPSSAALPSPKPLLTPHKK